MDDFLAGLITGCVATFLICLGGAFCAADAGNKQSSCNGYSAASERECRVSGDECQCRDENEHWETVIWWKG